jgi:hypothetical protein
MHLPDYAGGADQELGKGSVEGGKGTSDEEGSGKEAKGAPGRRNDMAAALELQDAAMLRYEKCTGSDHLLILNAYEVRQHA